MLEGRTIKLWSYNLETILAEKLETVFTRGLLNTRMRDFYDIHTLLQYQGEGLDVFLLRKAFDATCQKRNRKYILDKAEVIINSISDDENLQNLWKAYQRKYVYASDIMFSDTIESIHTLLDMITRE